MASTKLYLAQLLEQTLSINAAEAEAAQLMLYHSCKYSWQVHLMKLSSIIYQAENSVMCRKAAAMQFTQCLTATEGDAQQMQIDTRWLAVNDEIRNRIKGNLLRSLDTLRLKPHPTASCIVAVAAIEFPSSQWLNLIKTLMQNISCGQSGDELAKASLETIGSLCQDIWNDGRTVLVTNVTAILKAIMVGMSNSKNDITLAAAEAFEKSLEIFGAIFSDETERELVVQVLCEAAELPSLAVKAAILDCFSSLVLYYAFCIENYMDPNIFHFIENSLKSEDQEVRNKAVKFCIHLCNIEQRTKPMTETLDKHLVLTTADDYPYPVSKALLSFLPIFMEMLIVFANNETSGIRKDDDDYDETCKILIKLLEDMVNCYEDGNVDQSIIRFVKDNINHSDWRCRSAAVKAINSILKKDWQSLQQFVPVVVQTMLHDDNTNVRAASARTVAEMCILIERDNPNLKVFLPALLQGLRDQSNVATNAAKAIANLANSGKGNIGMHVDKITQKLLDVIERTDTSPVFQTFVSSALQIVIGTNKESCYLAVNKIILILTTILQKSFLDNKPPNSLLVLRSNLEKFFLQLPKHDVIVMCDQLMRTLVESNKPWLVGVRDDMLLLLISTTIKGMGRSYVKYLEYSSPFLVPLVHEQSGTGVKVIKDLCQAVGVNISPYCDALIFELLDKLKDPRLTLQMKHDIVVVIGDVALCLGPCIEKYVEPVLEVFFALQSDFDEINADQSEYSHMQTDLHMNLLKAYKGIYFALENDLDSSVGYLKLLRPCVVNMIQAISRIVKNHWGYLDSFVPTCIKELDDLCVIFDSKILEIIDTKPVTLILEFGSRSDCPMTKSRSNALKQKILDFKNPDCSFGFFKKGLDCILKFFATV